MKSVTGNQKNVNEIQNWIIQWLEKEGDIKVTDIDLDEPFVNFGPSSRQAVFLIGELEDWSGMELDPSLAWDYPTICKLAGYVANHPSS